MGKEAKKEELKKEKVTQAFNPYEIYGKLMVEREIIDHKIQEIKKVISDRINKGQVNGKK